MTDRFFRTSEAAVMLPGNFCQSKYQYGLLVVILRGISVLVLRQHKRNMHI